MSRKKRNHTAAFKAKVALAAMRERQTQGQITSEYEIHSTQVRRWRDQALQAVQGPKVTKLYFPAIGQILVKILMRLLVDPLL